MIALSSVAFHLLESLRARVRSRSAPASNPSKGSPDARPYDVPGPVVQPVRDEGVPARGAAALPPERVPELRGGTLAEDAERAAEDAKRWTILEARVTHLEHLLHVAVEVVAKTNGLQADQIRFMLECDVEDRYGSDSDGDDDPTSSPRPALQEGLWPSRTPAPPPSGPSFQVLLGGRT